MQMQMSPVCCCPLQALLPNQWLYSSFHQFLNLSTLLHQSLIYSFTVQVFPMPDGLYQPHNRTLTAVSLISQLPKKLLLGQPQSPFQIFSAQSQVRAHVPLRLLSPLLCSHPNSLPSYFLGYLKGTCNHPRCFSRK